MIIRSMLCFPPSFCQMFVVIAFFKRRFRCIWSTQCAPPNPILPPEVLFLKPHSEVLFLKLLFWDCFHSYASFLYLYHIQICLQTLCISVHFTFHVKWHISFCNLFIFTPFKVMFLRGIEEHVCGHLFISKTPESFSTVWMYPSSFVSSWRTFCWLPMSCHCKAPPRPALLVVPPCVHAWVSLPSGAALLVLPLLHEAEKHVTAENSFQVPSIFRWPGYLCFKISLFITRITFWAILQEL